VLSLALASSIHNKQLYETQSNGKMEEDTEPKDEDGVDGRGVCGRDGWVCCLDAVGASPIFGLVRRAGAFAPVLPTFVLVSRMQLAQQYRGNGHFLSVTSSSRREAMVGGTLVRTLPLRPIFGLVRRPRAFAPVLPTFVLVSRMQLV
jgi:hypothetical protein